MCEEKFDYTDDEYNDIKNDKRSRGWVFTDFQIPEVLEEDFYDVEKLGAAYMIYGLEKAPTTGKLHYQGYVYFEEAKSFSKMRKLLPNIRIAVAKGTARQNYVYCSKDGKFWEYGDIPKQGKRSDLEDVAKMVKEKKTIKEIANTYPVEYIKFYKGIQALKCAQYEDRVDKPLVQWFQGATGAGKTRKAVEISGGDYYVKDSSQWWDGYEQQGTIIIDDFDSKKWDYRDLLRLLDRYKYQGQTKGGYVKVNSPNIIITCDGLPDCHYKDGELAQLMRRIDKVEHIEK